MLLKRDDLRDRIIRLMGKGHVMVTTRALDEAGKRISRYLLMLVIVNASYGVAVAVGLAVIGVPYAVLWGFLAATLRFVPYIGAWVAAVLPITLSFATSQGWTEPLLVVGLILVLELLSNNVMEPLLYGRSIGVSEVALLLAAAFWGWLWGPIGLVLSAPLTVCLAVLGKYVPPLEFFEVLLKDEPALDPHLRYYQRLLARNEDEALDIVEEYARDHPWEDVFDDVLLPALQHAKRDKERGELDAEEEQFLVRATQDILDDLVLTRQQAAKGEAPPPERPPVVVFGCPAQDRFDEIALQMFRQLMEPAGCRVEVFSSRSLAGEVTQRAGEEAPAAVILAALPPGGLAQARHLCKRLRAAYPELKVVVGRWGADEEEPRVRDALLQAGAETVTTSLGETRSQIMPVIQLAATQAESRPADLEPAASRG
jgi:hypothetical protein